MVGSHKWQLPTRKTIKSNNEIQTEGMDGAIGSCDSE